jgi:VanZ family protein
MAFVPAVLVTAGIAVLSLTEASHMPSVQVNDKLVHGLMYAVLAVAWLWPLLRWSHTRVIPYIFVIAGTTAYGALMEALQRFCTLTRTGTMDDLLADFLGALVGAAAVAIINHKFEITNHKS